VGEGRRDPLEIVGDISSFLRKHEGLALSPTEIAQETKLNYNSCRDYLEIIKQAQELPKIKTIKRNKGVLVMIEKDLDEYSESKQKRILKEEFGITPDESDKLYLGLLNSKPKKLEMTKEVEEGLKYRHLAKTKDGKIYLTSLGKTIAKGAKKLFG